MSGLFRIWRSNCYMRHCFRYEALLLLQSTVTWSIVTCNCYLTQLLCLLLLLLHSTVTCNCYPSHLFHALLLLHATVTWFNCYVYCYCYIQLLHATVTRVTCFMHCYCYMQLLQAPLQKGVVEVCFAILSNHVKGTITTTHDTPCGSLWVI